MAKNPGADGLLVSFFQKAGFTVYRHAEAGWKVLKPDLDLHSDTYSGAAHSMSYPDLTGGGDTIPCLPKVLLKSLQTINSDCSDHALDNALNAIMHPRPDTLELVNEYCHKLLIGGVSVSRQCDGEVSHEWLHVLHPGDAGRNSRIVLEEVTWPTPSGLRQGRFTFRWVVFLNGLPVAVFFLQPPHPAEKRNLEEAYYDYMEMREVCPLFFAWNVLIVISDGFQARMGSLTTLYDRFMPWSAPHSYYHSVYRISPLESLVKGVLAPGKLEKIIRHFILFRKTRRNMPVGATGVRSTVFHLEKIIAARHQYEGAINAAANILAISENAPDRRGGVIHHAQGSGKSLTMVFLAGLLQSDPALRNPTILVLTDRCDLEDQLFDAFASSVQLLRQSPLKIHSRRQLRRLLKPLYGGIIFITLQKFLPSRFRSIKRSASEDRYSLFESISGRKNIIVFADEAHRSHYGLLQGLAYYLHRVLPRAIFVGFTGTPLETRDRCTTAVFGGFIHEYNASDAIRDGMTVEIMREDRSGKLNIAHALAGEISRRLTLLDDKEIPLETEITVKRSFNLELLLTDPHRLKSLAKDIIDHYESRRKTGKCGKGIIAVISRYAAVELYNTMIRLRPVWSGANDSCGSVKVVITGSSWDPPQWRVHCRDKEENRRIGERFRDPDDPLMLVIVCDMWLTGFDAPWVDILYLDKPLKGHRLAQAAARVNRVRRGKVAGWIVDYLGVSAEWRNVPTDGSGLFSFHQTPGRLDQALEILHEEYFNFSWALRKCYPDILFCCNYKQPEFTRQFMARLLIKNDEAILIRRSFLRLTRAYQMAAAHPMALNFRSIVKVMEWCFQSLNGGKKGAPRKKIRAAEGRGRALRVLDRALYPDRTQDVYCAADIRTIRPVCPEPDVIERLEKGCYGNQRLLMQTLEIHFSREFSKPWSRMGYLALILARFGAIMRSFRCRLMGVNEVVQALTRLAGEWSMQEHLRSQFRLRIDEYSIFRVLMLEYYPQRACDCFRGIMILREAAREMARVILTSVIEGWSKRESGRARLNITVKRILRKSGFPVNPADSSFQALMQLVGALAEESAKPGRILA